MNRLSEFWFFFGAALAAQDGSPTDLWRAHDGVDEAVATINELAENQFLDSVLVYLRPYNEFHDAVVQVTIELYYDLMAGPPSGEQRSIQNK